MEKISSQDIAGYTQAQKLLATYQANLAEVRVRRQAEQASVEALEEAQAQIQYLLRASEQQNPNYTISQLLGIINQLKKVQPGTTAYPETQQLMRSANNKLNQLTAKPN